MVVTITKSVNVEMLICLNPIYYLLHNFTYWFSFAGLLSGVTDEGDPSDFEIIVRNSSV